MRAPHEQRRFCRILRAARQAAVAIGLALCATHVDAQPQVSPEPSTLPEILARDDQGRATIRAVRVTAPMHVDGTLDEAIYSSVLPASDFIQMEPRGGQVATEKTEVWLFYDHDNVYVTFRAWESAPDRTIANEMRRDSGNIRQGDSVGWGFDTFRDRRNAFQFEANSLGARTDGQSTNERQYNADWNPVWRLAAGTFDGGWTIEAAIPFKSLRYAPGTVQDWGFQARRTNKWKNEIAYLTKIPPAFGLGRADFSASLFANVVGLEAPPVSRNLELKPYAIADLTTDNVSTPRRRNDPGGDVGLDAKYSITQNITADLTYNTDFAQVEADEQQVNLTRFSLFFPEKRDFFLENQGIFTFGNNSTGTSNNSASDVPLLFYSRRIGLAGNRQVPIWGGGRVTGRVGRYQVGLIDMQTKEDASAAAPSTNFSVVRVKRDIFRRSSVGLLATSRSSSQIVRDASSQAYGVDGTFAFFTNWTVATYYAQTRVEGRDDQNASYRLQTEYAGDRYGLQLERLTIDPNFNPEVGFLRRTDMRKNYAQVRFSPRPKRIRSVRKFYGIGQFTYVEDAASRLTTRLTDGEFNIEFQNSDRFIAGIQRDYELITRPFGVVPGAVIPVGGYDFSVGRLGYTFGQQRKASANVLLEVGNFYNGSRTGLTINRSRINLSSQLSVEPSITLNWFDLPAGAFTSRLIGSRVTYTATPLLFVSALVQYNSSTHSVSTNARLRWEYRPGSELFVVYNEERDSAATGSLPGVMNRTFVIKVNRFFRF
ncbi:MAG: carbohydrate binding family 9 domain-containing protein [Acidobacteria bacterium]|nr:carbohydrate binding family 9 domain-containing protein [Acidobacteriota bacterium]